MRLFFVLVLVIAVTVAAQGDTCRSMTKTYLDRVINGPEGRRREVVLRSAQEHLNEVQVAERHPEGAASKEALKQAEDSVQKAEAQLQEWRLTTERNVTSRLGAVCQLEAEAAGNGRGLMRWVYTVNATAFGAYDSIYTLLERQLTEITDDLTLIMRRTLQTVKLAYKGERPEWDQWMDFAKGIGYGVGGIVGLLTFYVVASFAFPTVVFYYVGYQYFWLVLIKVLFLDNTVKSLAAKNPGASPEALLYDLVAGDSEAMLTAAFFLAFFGLSCAVFSFFLMPWLIGIFHINSRRSERVVA